MPSNKKLKETNQLIHKFMEAAGSQDTPNSKRGIDQVDITTPSPDRDNNQPSLTQIRQVIREELHSAIGDFTATFDNLKDEVTHLKRDVINLTASLEQEKIKNQDLAIKVQNFDKFMLRNNLIVKNIGCLNPNRETKFELESRLLRLLRQCSVFLPSIAIADIERISTSSPISTNNLPVRITFHHPKDKHLVLSSKTKIREVHNIIIEEEYPEAVIADRLKLLPILKAARFHKHYATINQDQLTIDDNVYTTNNLDKLPNHLKPDNSTTLVKNNVIAFYKRTSLFSNHHPCKISLQGKDYNCAEQAYAYAKANQANDSDAEREIMQTDDPILHKQIMKRIKLPTWDTCKLDIMENIIRAKFSQNENLREELLNTKDKTLVEGNPYDTFWGAGISIYNPKIWDKEQWRGSNKLGDILMKIRSEM